jgi:ribonuclease HI
MLDSVQQCEARAILKAVQLAEKGEAVHIHTDSKGTVQKIRAMLGKAYREKRGITNKGIIQEIIDLSDMKQIPIMIEWVKGHETMAEGRHNWISRMKQQGNEWVDEVAKQATAEEDTDIDFPIDQEWIVITQSEGKYVDWKALPKVYKETKRSQRTERLAKPSDPRVSKYGQGRRMQEAKSERTILFKQAMKSDTTTHNMAIRYVTNKIGTREFQARQERQRGKTPEKKD